MTEDIAHALVRPGGSGDVGDSALVAMRLAKFSYPILTRLWNDGTRLVACRGSITDYLTELRGVQPRGWPPGSTWDSVPGIFYPSTNEVVIAIVGHAEGNPHLPATGEGQGSADMVIHETTHGVDGPQFNLSSSQEFIAARNADLAVLPPYESQPIPAGEQETFAESSAMYATGNGAWPHLYAYWAAIESAQALPPPPPEIEAPAPTTIGSASIDADHTIALHLRATTDDGAIGCALLTYRSDHAHHSHVLSHLDGLRSGETKHVLPFPVAP